MCYAPIENFFLVLARPRVILNACERLHVNQSMYDMYNLDGVFIIAGPTDILISACCAYLLAKVIGVLSSLNLAIVKPLWSVTLPKFGEHSRLKNLV